MKDVLRVTVPIVLVAALIAVASSGLADAQPSARTFVKGTVTSAGKPARSVWVIISLNGGEKGRSLTGDDGKYYIAGVDPGSYDFVVVGRGVQLYKGRATLPITNGTFDISF
jgi:hypothetical protein